MTQPTIGLALGGGGARGLAHIHVFWAFEQLGLKPSALSGTSIGSIMGAGYASGMTASDIEDYVVETFTDPTEVLARFWRMRPGGISEMISGPRSMMGNINPVKAVKAFLPEAVPGRFEQLSIPLQVVATDFYGQKQVVFNQGDLVEAIAASSSLPAVFRPIQRDGMALVDGGIVNSVPYELLQKDCEIVIAIDVVGGPLNTGKPAPSRIEALAGASQLMMQATTRLKCKINPPDALITPPVNGIGVLDFIKAKRILAETISTVEQSKRAIEEAMKSQLKASA